MADTQAPGLILGTAQTRPTSHWRRLAIEWGVGVFITLGLLGGWSLWHFGSMNTGLAYLSGEPILLRPSSLDFGSVPPRGKFHREISLTNADQEDLTILGHKTTWDCVSISALPKSVRRGQTVRVEVVWDAEGATGVIKQNIFIYTDIKKKASLSFPVRGKVDTPRRTAIAMPPK